MSDKKKVDKVAEAEARPTVITLVLPVDKTKAATVTVRNGDLGHLSSFAYDDFKDICTALNDGMRAFVQVQAKPPQNIQAAKPVSKTGKTSKKKKALKKQSEAKGKAPYRLQDTSGQTRTLSKMLDPFELQEKYHKANPKFKFDSLDEACDVAQSLIDAGIEKTVTITYSNGAVVKVLPEKEVISTDTVAVATDDTITDDVPAVIVDVSNEVATVDGDVLVATEEVSNEVAIVDDASVSTDDVPTVSEEASIDDLSTTDDVFVVGEETRLVDTPAITEETNTADTSADTEDAPALSKQAAVIPAPVIQVLTSPELAEAEGVPEYNEFSLATADDDDDVASDEPSDSVAETAQATLF